MKRNRFEAWIRHHKLSNAAAARILGASENAVARWLLKEPPRYVLMACAAHSYGLPDLP